MTTVLDIIKRSLRLFSAIGQGNAPTASEASDALNVLNSMIDSWSIDRLIVYQILEENFTWSGGQISQTIGPAGNFNTVRPNRIDGIFARVNNVDYVTRLVDKRSYDSIAVKTTQSTYPNIMFYDPAVTIGVLYAYPVPSGALNMHIKSWKQLQSFTSLTDVVLLPPGYQRAIEYNLSCELSGEYPDLTLPSLVLQKSVESLAAIKTLNAPTLIGNIGMGKGMRYNIYADR